MATVQLPKLLTAQQLAGQTGLSLARVYELCRETDIPRVRLGRALRFDGEMVVQWLRAGGTSAPARAGGDR